MQTAILTFLQIPPPAGPGAVVTAVATMGDGFAALMAAPDGLAGLDKAAPPDAGPVPVPVPVPGTGVALPVLCLVPPLGLAVPTQATPGADAEGADGGAALPGAGGLSVMAGTAPVAVTSGGGAVPVAREGGAVLQPMVLPQPFRPGAEAGRATLTPGALSRPVVRPALADTGPPAATAQLVAEDVAAGPARAAGDPGSARSAVAAPDSVPGRPAATTAAGATGVGTDPVPCPSLVGPNADASTKADPASASAASAGTSEPPSGTDPGSPRLQRPDPALTGDRAPGNPMMGQPRDVAVEGETGAVPKGDAPEKADATNLNPGLTDAPDPDARTAAPLASPQATAAESLWHGAVVAWAPHSADNDAEPSRGIPTPDPGQSAAAVPPPDRASPAPVARPEEQLEVPFPDDPVPTHAQGWTSTGGALQPALAGVQPGPQGGAMPAATLPQLAAQIAASLIQRPDGTTEIALSPDQLGQVRLQLAEDARNPERMVIFLSFDRPETMDLFRRHADQLAEAIRAAGYAGADIGFGHTDSGHADGRDGSAGQSPAPADPGHASPDLSDPRPAPAARQGWTSGAGLDLRL